MLSGHWHKHGRLLAPSPEIPWLTTHAGSCTTQQVGSSALFNVYVTGRDANNRSRLGRVQLDMDVLTLVKEISTEPVLPLGQAGAFDDSGTSYPCLVTMDGKPKLFYTGWQRTTPVPFQNQLGLAEQVSESQFRPLSKAPVMPLTNTDFLGIGSSCAHVDTNCLRLWYTSFRRWDMACQPPRHYYHIRTAYSYDQGRTWERVSEPCIDFSSTEEYAICSPTVFKLNACWHMLFCNKTLSQPAYRIAYAYSADGEHWQRCNDAQGLTLSADGWDSEAMCYPHVFFYQEKLYLLYAGNDHGRTGLGLAELI